MRAHLRPRSPRGLRRRGSRRRRRGSRSGHEGVVVQEDEALLGPRHFDDRVEHRLQQRVDLVHRHQLLAELVEFAKGGELLIRDVDLRVVNDRQRALREGRAHSLGFVVHAEGERDVSERHPVAVHQASAPLLLAVDEDVGLLVDLLEVEVTAVEEHLGVGVGQALPRHGHVVAERPPHRCHRLVKHERPGRTLGRKPLEDRHRRDESCEAWRGEAGRPVGVPCCPAKSSRNTVPQNGHRGVALGPPASSRPRKGAAEASDVEGRRVEGLQGADDKGSSVASDTRLTTHPELRHKKPRPRPLARGPFGGEDDHEENRNCRASGNRGGGGGPRGLRRRNAGARHPRHQRVIECSSDGLVGRTGDQQVVAGGI